MPVKPEILRGNFKKDEIYEISRTLQIKENDFVFGIIGRMEKFSAQYIDLCIQILNRFKNTKLLIAGPNDNRLVLNKLNVYIKNLEQLFWGNDAHKVGYL